jgi:hypothetical protein
MRINVFIDSSMNFIYNFIRRMETYFNCTPVPGCKSQYSIHVLNKKLSNAAYSLSICLFLVISHGCSNKNKSNEALLVEHSQQETSHMEERIPDKKIAEIIRSIPSPVETSSLIKQSGGLYNVLILNSTDNSNKYYHSNFDKAINLGIYGTDLGYVNIYNQSQDALAYLNCIQSLADELKIGHFFEYDTFKRMALNNNNMDSVMYLTIANFERMNNFLHEQKRSDQSILILSGGWLEALYISCTVAKTNKNKDLLEKIGEQKIVLDQLLLLLSNYQHDENIDKLHKKFQQLQDAYKEVKIVTTFKNSEMHELKGVYIIDDKSESHVEITESQLQEIGRITESIRQTIII